MIGVAEKLADIEDVRHTIYADDITLEVTVGSDTHIDGALQAAVDAIENQLEGTGLRCSPSKSELLIIQPTNNGRGKTRQREYENIRIVTKSGNVIPEVGKIRILGRVIEKHRRIGETVARLTAKAANATRQRDSSNESPYKTALGLFESTSTTRFLQLGIHNTLEEIAEAQRIAQLERLSTTETGRRILDDLGIGYSNETETKLPVPEEVRSQTRIDPIPNKMNPDYNKEEEQRGRRLSSTCMAMTGTRAASVRSAGVEQAEEVAISLAIADAECHTVLSDSRQALRNYSKGQICRKAERVLRAVNLQDRKVRIKLFPAHAGDALERNDKHNETAHAAARALTNRASATDHPTWFEAKARMADYNDITEAYRLARRTLPPPHTRLSRAEAVLLRQLQTGSLPSPGLTHHMNPETYPTDRCKVCRKETADHTHILCDCIKHEEEARSRTIPSRLEAAAKSYDQDQQLWAVQQVLGALKRQGPGEPTTASRDPRRETATPKTT
ncbi:hypothetical protein HPB47_019444 [Ixodes persulcatus]|uniref:Uncharacterized protein n=1 Tax=Ixodes persulcatus TaxID=34615 RepID=A0AC60QLQ4_IXOPE|nr:hypothetical protein HPB47_019444 [Ixodes persulcatus]